MNNDILIAAHRGMFGGNVIQNTILAFENALKNGADIIEGDVARSSDGRFFAFHTGQEKVLGLPKSIDAMTSSEVSQVRLLSSTGEITDQKLNTIDEVLDTFKGRCLINIDRSWPYGREYVEYISKKRMKDQILIKSPVTPSYLSTLNPDIMYMPIIHKAADFELISRYKLNLYGVEFIFANEDSPIVNPDFINVLDKNKIKKWANAININNTTILSANHDDNTSILYPDNGWGWLINKGFDIIQTDWPMLLKMYLLKITLKSVTDDFLSNHV